MERVDKPVQEKTRGEIESKLNGMGDYVKMSYLQRAMNSGLGFDTRKFVMLRLAGIYEGRKMYLEAARMLKGAAEINTTTADKIKDFMRAVELFVKGGDYAGAERLFALALALGDSAEKNIMKVNYKNYYLTQAKFLMSNDKRNHAKIAFERCLKLELAGEEKKEVQDNLLLLYNKLGLVREFYRLKSGM